MFPLNQSIPLVTFILVYLCFLSESIAQLDDSFPSESALLQDRITRGGDHLLVDGNFSLVNDSIFNLSPEFNPTLFAIHPLNIMPFNPYFSKKMDEFLYLEANLGNEVGDPHLHEVTGATYKNHTPFLQNQIRYNPTKNISLFLKGHQNDHFTYTTVGARSYLTHDNKEAWFGENLPTKSLLTGGLHLTAPRYDIQFILDKGWQWTPSPYSGFSYPWKGYQTRTKVNYGKFLRLTYTQNQWNSISKWDKKGEWRSDDWLPELIWNKEKKNQKLQAVVYSGITYQKIDMEKLADAPRRLPSIGNSRERTYRTGVQLRAKHILHDSLTIAEVNAKAEIIENKPFVKLRVAWEQRPPLGHLKQSLFVHHWHPGVSSFIPRETLNSGEETLTQIENSETVTGMGAQVNYSTRGPYKLGVFIIGSSEWGLPLFHVDSLAIVNHQILRWGGLQNRSHAIHRLKPGLKITMQPLPWFEASSQISHNRYFTQTREPMEFSPSQIQSLFQVKIHTPSSLVIQLSSGYFSEKKLRNWNLDGSDWIVPGHWENNLSLGQYFNQGKIKFHLTALHLWGEEVLEHPNGNPLRFRIIVGGQASF